MKRPPQDNMDTTASSFISAAFLENRERLARLAARRMKPQLTYAMSTDDILQETFIAALKRRLFFESRPEVPVYFKFRLVLLQVMAETERRRLGTQKRDPEKEVRFDAFPDSGFPEHIEDIPDDAPSPATQLAREERRALIKHAIRELAPNDREILTLRHFDGLSNQECASVLSIDPKAASIRYARALIRLRDRLIDYSEFKQ